MYQSAIFEALNLLFEANNTFREISVFDYSEPRQFKALRAKQKK